MAISTYLKSLREKIGTTLLQIPAVTAVIRDDTGGILLQRSIHDEWSLPAGAIDLGESPAQAIVREVWEETGLKVRPIDVLGIFGGCNGFRHTYPNGDRVEYTCIVFVCNIVGGQLGGRDDETLELQYFNLEKMPKLAIEYPPSIFKPDASEVYFDWNERWLERMS
jgi:8-oxo-dGTP pyrophosphatase MutT (NUDIX family)